MTEIVLIYRIFFLNLTFGQVGEKKLRQRRGSIYILGPCLSSLINFIIYYIDWCKNNHQREGISKRRKDWTKGWSTPTRRRWTTPCLCHCQQSRKCEKSCWKGKILKKKVGSRQRRGTILFFYSIRKELDVQVSWTPNSQVNIKEWESVLIDLMFKILKFRPQN